MLLCPPPESHQKPPFCPPARPTTSSSQDIKTLGRWLVAHRDDARTIVTIWAREVCRGPASNRGLTLPYVQFFANNLDLQLMGSAALLDGNCPLGDEWIAKRQCKGGRQRSEGQAPPRTCPSNCLRSRYRRTVGVGRAPYIDQSVWRGELMVHRKEILVLFRFALPRPSPFSPHKKRLAFGQGEHPPYKTPRKDSLWYFGSQAKFQWLSGGSHTGECGKQKAALVLYD